MNPRNAIVVILGSTAVGKSKLSIELARKFGGEIISADSMQIYSDLDIVTAKVTPEEQKIVPHHLLSFVNPSQENFTVTDFQRRALSIIKDLHRVGKVPVIAGGTNYYIESLLWDFTMERERKANERAYSETTQDLYKELSICDPDTASRLHPNNRRKIITALKFFDNTGQQISAAHRAQHSKSGDIADGGKLGGKLRFENIIAFYIGCDMDILEKRIADRVDKMLDDGLIGELERFYTLHHKFRKSDGFETGVYQVLGLKEFEPYLTLTSEVRSSKKGQKIFGDCVALLKQRSLRYAKYQLKWIGKRFFDRSSIPIYPLNSSDVSLWNSNVFEPAAKTLESLLAGNKPELEPMKSFDAIRRRKGNPHTRYVCEVCDKVLIGDVIWQDHCKSKQHKARMRKRPADHIIGSASESKSQCIDSGVNGA